MASFNKGVLPAPCLVYGKIPIFILESMVKIMVSHRGILCTENNSWACIRSYTMPMFFFLLQMETESLWLWHSANKWKKMCQDPWHNNMSKRSVWFLHVSDDLWCYFPHQMKLALIDELLNTFLKNGEKRFWLAVFVLCDFCVFLLICCVYTVLDVCCIAYRKKLCDILVEEFGFWIKRRAQVSKSISFKYSLLWLVMSDSFPAATRGRTLQSSANYKAWLKAVSQFLTCPIRTLGSFCPDIIEIMTRKWFVWFCLYRACYGSFTCQFSFNIPNPFPFYFHQTVI